MCTLTFIPGVPGGGYLLATNRDESPDRGEGIPPSIQEIGGRQVIAPRDADAGGTWVGVDEHGCCVSILNGDKPGSATVSAPTSRGQLVMDLLKDPRFPSVRNELERRRFLGSMDFKPFKLVVVSPGPVDGGRPAHVLRALWNGSYLAFEEEQGPRCVVSSSFEPSTVTGVRTGAFSRLIEAEQGALRDVGEGAADSLDGLAGKLLDFQSSHTIAFPDGDAHSVCMHRGDARTVSGTLVQVTKDQVSMRYQAGWPCKDGEVVEVSIPRTP